MVFDLLATYIRGEADSTCHAILGLHEKADEQCLILLTMLFHSKPVSVWSDKKTHSDYLQLDIDQALMSFQFGVSVKHPVWTELYTPPLISIEILYSQ